MNYKYNHYCTSIVPPNINIQYQILIIIMGKKSKQVSYSSSSDSSSQSETSHYSSQCQSSSSSDSSSCDDNRLTKSELKELIKLEKKIKKQQKLLKKEKKSKKSKPTPKKQQIKRQGTKRSQKSQIKQNNQTAQEIGQGRKLFITGIQDKYTQVEVSEELKKILNPIQGVIDFRIKRKQGCHTYAFVDFLDKNYAKEAIQKLRKKRIFGQKIAIYYSQDQAKQKPRQKSKQKKCFQCNGVGHFARECQTRNSLPSPMQDQDEHQLWSPKDGPDKQNMTGETYMQAQLSEGKVQPEQQQQKSGRKRIIREKNRLNRLSNRDG